MIWGSKVCLFVDVIQEVHKDQLTEKQKNYTIPNIVLYECGVCNKAFHSKFVQKVHVKAHKKAELKPCGMDNYYKFYLNVVTSGVSAKA